MRFVKCLQRVGQTILGFPSGLPILDLCVFCANSKWLGSAFLCGLNGQSTPPLSSLAGMRIEGGRTSRS